MAHFGFALEIGRRNWEKTEGTDNFKSDEIFVDWGFKANTTYYAETTPVTPVISMMLAAANAPEAIVQPSTSAI